MSGKFIESILCGDVWKVLIYDKGLVKMSKFDSEKNAFVECTFATKEEADKAGREYEESCNNKIYISILYTYDEVYAIGKTYEESRENVARGYRKLYKPSDRTPDTRHGTVKELEEYFGIHTHEIDIKKGYTW